MSMRSFGKPLVAVALAAALASPAAAETVVATLTDGPQSRAMLSMALVEREVRALVREEFDVRFPADKALDGGWTQEGIRNALQQLLTDPDVDIIIARGVVSSHEAAKLPNLTKPVIATVVPDLEVQGFPFEGGVSGKRNFVYLSNLRGIETDFETLDAVVNPTHIAVLIDELINSAIPELVAVKPPELESELGVRVSVVPVGDSWEAGVAAIPEDADAVYVAPLLRLDETKTQQLANALIERRLPSFSSIGRGELPLGFLLAASGRVGDDVRLARRIALDLQQLLLGEPAASIKVDFRETQRLAINMRTARALGFTPRYAVLADAEQLYDDEAARAPELTIAEAMAAAVENNLGLSVSRLNPAIAGADVLGARSVLLPQLGIAGDYTRIDADRASPLFQSERSASVNLSASQVVYSADAWAGYRIAQYLQDAESEALRGAILDVVGRAAEGYLQVLRARALESVQRSNLEVTRQNLELSQVRESIGISGRADVLRWESQIASDRQNLIAAEASRRAAITALNQTLNRSLNLDFKSSEDDLAESIAIFEGPRFRTFIDNAAVWETFQDFQVMEALANSPELKEVDRLLDAQASEVTAAQRRYYLPELSLAAGGGSVLSRSGAGSDLSGTGLDDESWNVGLVAQWPLFTSGALKSRLSKARLQRRQIERQRAAVEEQIQARVRIALHQASGSFPAIELSSDAARAAIENLALVTDAYSKGAVSVTDLIDAQNAALAAELRAAEARYAYLIDLVEILRSTSDFSLLVDPASSPIWFDRVERFFKERGVDPKT